MKWFVLEDMLDKTCEYLNKQDTNLKVNAMFGTDMLLAGIETHSVIRLDTQMPQCKDKKQNIAIFLQILFDISRTNIRIELQINRIYRGHIRKLINKTRSLHYRTVLNFPLSVNVTVCIILIT